VTLAISGSFHDGGLHTFINSMDAERAISTLHQQIRVLQEEARNASPHRRNVISATLETVSQSLGDFIATAVVADPISDSVQAVEDELGQSHLLEKVQERADELQTYIEEISKVNDDISREKDEVVRMNQILAKSEERFRSMIENASDIIVLLDVQGTITYASPSVKQIGGYDPSDLVGTNVLDLAHPDDALVMIAALREALSSPRRLLRLEARIKDAAGAWHVLEITGRNLLDIESVQGIVVNARDITERREAEEALRDCDPQLRERLSEIDAMYRYAPIGLCIFDTDLRWVRLNERLAEINGLPLQEHIGRTPREIVPDVGEQAEEALRAILATGEPLLDFEMKGTTRAQPGVVRYWNERWAPIKDEEGRITGITAAAEEITERKRAEEQVKRYAENLKRSNEDLERFAYIASHDLQEPIRVMVSYAQLLARRYTGRLDPDADEYIRFIEQSGKQMQGLITDLLAYSRISSQGNEAEPTSADDVVCEAIELLQMRIEETGATIVTRDPLPIVMADPGQLRQVFQNLIGNAIKFRKPDEPPRIQITAEKHGTMWQFAVSDNGIGIEPEYLDRIFMIFQRLHGRDSYPGTGIGLTIVKRIVERHGGKIWVASEPGEGSTFYFTLPAVTTEHSSIASEIR